MRPKRPRKLLLHKRQIDKLAGAVEREGMTIVPLKLYFNEKGRAKLEIAVARGKKLHDKRETDNKRTWDRERGRLLRSQGIILVYPALTAFVIAASAISPAAGLQPRATQPRSSLQSPPETNRPRR